MKKSLFIVCCLSATLPSLAQEAMFGIGYSGGSQLSGFYSSSLQTFTFSQRYRFHISDHQSFSLDMPISIGSAGFDIFIQTPLIFDFNYGAGSSKKNTDRFGYFVGAGVAFQGISDELYDGPRLQDRYCRKLR